MVDRVSSLDFGSQVTQLIARRVRESGVYCEIHPFTIDAATIKAFAPRAVILSGGPASVHEHAAPLGAEKRLQPGRAAARHLLRRADDLRAARRPRHPVEHREFGRAFIDVIGECGSSTASGRRAAASRYG